MKSMTNWTWCMLLAGLLVGGCGPEQRRDRPAEQTADRPIDPALTEEAERVVASLAKAVRPVTRSSSGPLRIELTRPENLTGSSAERFAPLADRWLALLGQIGPRHGLELTPSTQLGNLPPHRLHTRVLSMAPNEPGQWLLRLRLIGPDAAGQRRLLWDQTATTPAPPPAPPSDQ